VIALLVFSPDASFIKVAGIDTGATLVCKAEKFEEEVKVFGTERLLFSNFI
jgi:hypothetical protein